MDLNKFRTSKELEVKGVDVPVSEDCTLRIARMNNTAYKTYFNELIEPYRMQIRTGTMSEEIADAILIKSVAKTILLGWEGLKLDGRDIPYSFDNAVKALTEYKDFRDMVVSIAQDMDLFREKEMSDSAKNSEPTSDGN